MAGRRIGAAAFLIAATVACSPDDLSGERDFDDVAVVGLAPGPEDNRESIVQVYAARSYEPLSRLVSVHTWIAYRQEGQSKYTLYEAHRFTPYVTGKALRTCQKYYPIGNGTGQSPRFCSNSAATRRSRRSRESRMPSSLYRDGYRLWPGPNSNTLVAELVRAVDELQVDLPPTAIGKDFLPNWRIVAPAPSGTGWQVSLGGVLGVLVALEEGIEINLLGAVFGVDLNPPAFKLPIVGRLGFPQGKRADPSDVERLRHLPVETRCH